VTNDRAATLGTAQSPEEPNPRGFADERKREHIVSEQQTTSAVTGVDAAIAMGALGYHVRPCRLVLEPDGVTKTPHGLGAQWQSAGWTTAADIRRRWDEVGATGYMIPCGPSGVTVVDLDMHPERGVDGVASWAAADGPNSAFVVRTWSGGWHLYYASGGATNGRGLGVGVDVRGTGGGVFGPGSVVVDAAGREVGSYTVVRGDPDRSLLTVEPLVLAGMRKAAGSAAVDPFFAPAMTASAALDRANREVAEVATMPNVPGTGMRQRINDAALFVGGLLHTGWFTRDEAVARLMAACDQVYGRADSNDLKWVETALMDGANKPVNVVPDLPPPGETNVDDTNKGHPNHASMNLNNPHVKLETSGAPRRLPMIGDAVWEHYAWTRSIRAQARARRVCPDAVLGAMLATYAARVPPSVRIETGVKMALGTNLVVSLVGPSGSDKSTAFRMATQIATESAVPVVSNPNSGEAFAASFTHADPAFEGSPAKAPRVLKPDPRALFYIAEGGLIAGVGSRNGSTWLPHLRALAMDEALSTTNATAEINRQVPDGSYSAGLVVGFQTTTAMTVLDDTSTGTAQRFLWFTALSSEDYGLAPVGSPWVPMATVKATRLGERVDAHNNLEHVLTVVGSITARLVAEQDHDRMTRDLAATDDHDAHRHVLVAKIAALAVLADDRVLIEESDWQWAQALYAASAATRDELLGLALDRAADEVMAAAARAGAADFARKNYPASVTRVSGALIARFQQHGPQTRGALNKGLTSRDRPYLDDALAYALAQGWSLLK
jgi:hypothetical protein